MKLTIHFCNQWYGLYHIEKRILIWFIVTDKIDNLKKKSLIYIIKKRNNLPQKNEYVHRPCSLLSRYKY